MTVTIENSPPIHRFGGGVYQLHRGDPGKDGATFSLIRSKLAPPLSVAHAIKREALLARICASSSRPLTVINAPAGYGKTTLLTQCAERWSASGAVVAWYSVDDDPYERNQFFAYMIAALANVGAASPYSPEALAKGLTNLSSEAAARALIIAIESSEEPVRLIVDDYHHVAHPELDGAMNYLIRRMPAHGSLLIASRGDPGIATASLKVSGHLLSLDQADLRFSLEESCDLLSSVAADRDIHLLAEQAEGWPAALGLLRHRLESRSDPVVPLSSLDVRSHDLTSYLAEQVLLHLDPDIQQFLLRTSVATHLCAELANELTDQSDGSETLDRLARMNLLVTPLDPDCRWYRFHPLLLDFLRARLERQDRALVPMLNERAAAWHAKYGMLADALRHALLARRPALVAELLEAMGGWQIILRSGAPVLGHLHKLQIDDPLRFPRVTLAKIYLDGQQGRADKARATLDEFVAALETNPALLQLHPELDLELLATEISTRVYEDRPFTTEQVASVEQALASRKLSPLMKPLLLHFRSMMFYDARAYGECRSYSERALDQVSNLSAAHVENYMRVFSGLARVAQGRFQEAAIDFRRALERARYNFGDGSSQAGIIAALLGQVLYTLGLIGEAEQLISTTRPTIGTLEGWHDVFVALYSTSAWLKLRSGDVAGAFREVAAMRRLAHENRLHRLNIVSATLEARIALSIGQVGSETIARLEPPAPDVQRRDPDLQHRYDLTQAALLLVSPEPTTHLEAAARLAAIGACQLPLLLQIEHAILAACNAAQLERHGEAARYLRHAIDTARVEDVMAPFHELHWALKPAVEAAQANLNLFTAEQRARLAKLTTIASAAKPVPGLGMPTATDVLITSREVDVLRGLADGLSSKEMARVLGIAESTVRTHRLNLYRKLKVSTRSKAIAAARSMALL